ncbi:MAG: gluconokinase [Candidatus Latescibacterota bacterium]|nr:gluconokinase [Candidatus Latescibacterota bacterium]MEE3263774.1 gluconokinase [Candidatus Latescibacterota bacterium]
MTTPVSQPVALVLMGVTGSGKSTIGAILSDRLGWPFLDGDDFHPAENVAKMANGTPLTDEDRRPWLLRLSRELSSHLDDGHSCLLACSALRANYRSLLVGERSSEIRFIHLEGSEELIGSRLQDRVHRYMPASLLQSQFDALEKPAEALTVDIDSPPEKIADRIVKELCLHG